MTEIHGKSALFATCARLGVALPALALALLFPGPAYGQSAGVSDEQPAEGAAVAGSSDDIVDRVSAKEGVSREEIVVTGTLVRGVAPVGTNVITLGPETARAQGATTTNELLATVPQITNLFITVPATRLAGAPNQIQVVRPNLRGLSPETGSSSSTLVLIDGHRLAGVGITQAAIDPDVIPPAAIERVEIVTDGGSATYGADAVGGVINFVLRKRFDGVKVDGRVGFADGYRSYDANAIVGKDWGSGSLFAAYSHQENRPLFGRDRSFVRQIDYASGIPTGRSCNPGNVTLAGANPFVPGTSYALPALTTPGSFNSCASTDNITLMPRGKRDGVVVGLHQDLSPDITIDMRAFYSRRISTSYSSPDGATTVTSTNAFYRPIAANPTGNQTVTFTLAPFLGTDAITSGTGFNEWGYNAELKAGIFADWQVRALFNYSESESYYNFQALDTNLLTAAGRASNPQQAINFYNLSSTPNQTLFASLLSAEFGGEGKNRLLQTRAIADGTLLSLPGGDVKLAFGYEYQTERFMQRIVANPGPIDAIKSQAYTGYGRKVHSLFGELQVPIVGEENRSPGLYSLVVSAAGRYDHFSDFGSTTNSKFGITYQPIEGLALRANYGTSFNAPSTVDQLGSLRNSASYFPFNFFVRPGETPLTTGMIVLQGARSPLVPQTATTWSVGADINPSFLKGLRASVNYYQVKFKNLITIPSSNSSIFTNFPDNVVTNPSATGISQAQITAFLAQAPNAAAAEASRAGRPIYELVDFRQGNFGTLKVRGIDASVNYRLETSFGAIDGGVSGNYQLERAAQIGPGAAVVDELDFDRPRFTLQATLGADVGRFRAQATLNHVVGFDVVRSASLLQDHVSGIDTVGLFFQYRLPDDNAWLKNTAFTLNVQNVFDTDPPLYRSSGSQGYPPAQFNLGRQFLLGVSKQF